MNNGNAVSLNTANDALESELSFTLKQKGFKFGVGLVAGCVTYASVAVLLTGASGLIQAGSFGGPWLYLRHNFYRILSLLSSRAHSPLSAAGYDNLFPWSAALLTAGISITAAVLAYKFVSRKQLEKQAELTEIKHIRGPQLITRDELIAQVNTVDKSKMWFGPSEYTWVDGVPIATGRLQYNIWITGAVGAGKSQALFVLLDQVAARAKMMVIFDVVGDYVRYYYRPDRDKIWNPLDERGEGWSIFNEIYSDDDPEELAKMFLPIKNKNDQTESYFKGGVHVVIAAVTRRLIAEGRATHADWLHALFDMPVNDFHEWLKDTRAAIYTDPEAKGTGQGGFTSTMRQELDGLCKVRDGSFSIRKFIWEGGDRRLFLSMPESKVEQLQPLMSMAWSLATKASLDALNVPQSPTVDQRWFIADEFGSMGPVASAYDLATKGRKYGSVFVVGMQHANQVEDVMTEKRAETFRSVFQNKLIMKVADAKTAKQCSEDIGSHEVWDRTEGASAALSSSRDGASLNWARKELKLVMPDEIMQMFPLNGYLKLAGGYDTALVKFAPRDMVEIAPSFVPRVGSELDAHAKTYARQAAEADAAAQAETATPPARQADLTAQPAAPAAPVRAPRELF